MKKRNARKEEQNLENDGDNEQQDIGALVELNKLEAAKVQ